MLREFLPPPRMLQEQWDLPERPSTLKIRHEGLFACLTDCPSLKTAETSAFVEKIGEHLGSKALLHDFLCMSDAPLNADAVQRPSGYDYVVRSPVRGRIGDLRTVIHIMEPHSELDIATYIRLHAYLVNLKQDFGLAAPMAAIFYGNEWQFFWHEYASAVAEAITVEQARSASYAARVDYGTIVFSPRFSMDHPLASRFITSFFRKISATWYIPGRVRKWKPWRLDRSPTPKFLSTISEDDMHALKKIPYNTISGVEGRLLSCSDDGVLCFKMTNEGGENFVSKTGNNDRVSEECATWKRVYGEHVEMRVHRAPGVLALFMPFFEQITENQWEDPSTMPIVMRHVESLAKKGLFRLDIDRRHVVWANAARSDVLLLGWEGKSTEVEPDVDRETYLNLVHHRLSGLNMSPCE